MNISDQTEKVRVVRVLLVVRWPVGGIRTFLKYVTLFFPSEQYEFSIVGVNTDGMAALKDDIGHLVKSWNLVTVDGNELKSFHSAVTCEIRKNNFDLIHAHGFTSLGFSLIGRVFSRTPLICTSHDVLSTANFIGLKGKIKKVLLGISLKQCRAVHSVSFDAENNLCEYYPSILKKNGEVILNGVDTKHFYNAIAVDLKRSLNLDSKNVLIGFFGRFMSQKGFRYLVEALELLLKEASLIKFHVVCFGSGAFIREEKADIAKRGLSTRFTFLPFTPDVAGVMKGCDLIAMPSLWEACPLQPMEALCAGVPFVGSDCIGLREVLAGTPAVLVKVGDAKSLASGILECLSKGRQPFEKYATKAVERFDVRETAGKIHEMYNRVLR